ncbi:MAG: chromosome partitioning protein [Actinotalea sp.]|nr:chromosome partitioning protein [Actinotalea sp.]
MDDKLPRSFDNEQPDVPTLAVDPDPEVTEDGHEGPKYPRGSDADASSSDTDD